MGSRESLELALAEGQAREAKLRDALSYYTDSSRWKEYVTFDMNPLDRTVTRHPEKIVAEEALAIPQDDSALHEMIEAAKAEEREACAQEAERQAQDEPYGHAKFRCTNIAAEIRARKRAQ